MTWQRAYAIARQRWLESEGHVDWAQLPVETVFEGEQLGRWVQAQRAVWTGLDEEQRDLLSAVGIEEDPKPVAAKEAAKAKPAVSRTDRFAQGQAALTAFVERKAASSGASPAQGLPGAVSAGQPRATSRFAFDRNAFTFAGTTSNPNAAAIRRSGLSVMLSVGGGRLLWHSVGRARVIGGERSGRCRRRRRC
ncbi:helicase associated domain-containing protein [Kitasatospora sp. NPDC050463]|uniref:helicase associated domain-containing protein n=1 Tax=Kitasatospora sp. NPDC050463 TaxID=3155786 RepID=UPI0033E6FB14